MNKTQITNLLKLQKKALRLVFQARKNVHTDKLYKLSNIIPIDKLYETEATKFVFMHISDTTKDQQPKAIHNILFQKTAITRYTRLYDDESKIKINHEYRKGQAIYNLLDTWNNAKSDLRMAGNLFSLKKMIRNEFIHIIKPCLNKNCYICQLDKWKNYEKYMLK